MNRSVAYLLIESPGQPDMKFRGKPTQYLNTAAGVAITIFVSGANLRAMSGMEDAEVIEITDQIGSGPKRIGPG